MRIKFARLPISHRERWGIVPLIAALTCPDLHISNGLREGLRSAATLALKEMERRSVSRSCHAMCPWQWRLAGFI